MPYNYNITIKQPSNDSLGSSLEVLLDLLCETNKLNAAENVTFNLQELRFVFPFLILPLSALICRLKSEGTKVEIVTSRECSSYLDTICFPDGINPDTNNLWENSLNSFASKTYLPVCVIPIGGKMEPLREKLLTIFEGILVKQLDLNGQLRASIAYLLSESITNIVDHAKVSNGYIMVQNYSKKAFLDVSIVDTGIGILKSYNPDKFPEINTDEKAINNAVNGKSTKDIPESRGYGISTSRKMLVKGLHGIYFLFSGSAFYYWSNLHEVINVIDNELRWNGTMLALRIPKNIPEGFNYINFME